MKEKISVILACLGLYLITTGISYAAFSFSLGNHLSGNLTSPVGKVSPSKKPKYKVDQFDK